MDKYITEDIKKLATPTTLTLATVGAIAVQSNGANWMKLD